MIKYSRSLIFNLLGLCSLILGLLGVILPILPTTPFILLAAYFFSKGDNRLHSWLLENKLFGPMIHNWEKHKVIQLKAKIWATGFIIPLFSYTLIFVKVASWIKILVGVSGLGVLIFIWSRPHQAAPMK